MPDYTTKMSYEKAEEARRLFREGKSITYLCALFNLSDGAMRDVINGKSWVKKPPVDANPKLNPGKANKRDAVYTLLMNGMPPLEIAETIGASIGYVNGIQSALKRARKDPNWPKANDSPLNKWAQKKASSERAAAMIGSPPSPAPVPPPPKPDHPDKPKAEKLKACPFCSGNASLWYNTGKYGRFTYAECDVCGARSKAFSYYSEAVEFDCHELGAIRAADAWNRRAYDGE